MEYCIETEALTKLYGEFRAVDGLCLRVEKGCFYGFLGPNGAGKSTTIKMLTGITLPSSGSARLLGLDLARRGLEIKRRIGVVPEDLGLFDHLTAREYLGFIGRMHGLPREVILRRSGELLDLLGLAEAETTLALEYSHGMRKKLAFAAAILHNPELLFLDEPFEGIDAISSRTIRQVLDQIRRRGASIFLTSHILEIVERLCTHVGIIQSGRLVSQGTLEELTRDRSLEEAFLAAAESPANGQASLSWLGS